MKDGIYLQVVIVHDGKAFLKGKLIPLSSVTKLLTEKMCDGVEEIVTRNMENIDYAEVTVYERNEE